MKVKIRQWRLTDAKDLANALNNLKILNNLRDGLPFPYTETDGKQFINDMLSADKTKTFAFAVEVDGKVIGSVGAFRQNNVHCKTAEIGYYIAEEFWGKGIATSAVKSVCDYVFDHTDIMRIFAEPFADNAASCRVLEKAGFEYEGTLKSNAVKCGQVKDMKMYALIKN